MVGSRFGNSQVTAPEPALPRKPRSASETQHHLASIRNNLLRHASCPKAPAEPSGRREMAYVLAENIIKAVTIGRASRKLEAVSRLIPWVCLLSGLVAGRDGAPSRNILGSYFPSWMVCALVGIVLALVARAVLKVTGLLEELPAPLVVLLAFGCAVNFALWLIWLA
jgi:hypothetical protein